MIRITNLFLKQMISKIFCLFIPSIEDLDNFSIFIFTSPHKYIHLIKVDHLLENTSCTRTIFLKLLIVICLQVDQPSQVKDDIFFVRSCGGSDPSLLQNVRLQTIGYWILLTIIFNLCAAFSYLWLSAVYISFCLLNRIHRCYRNLRNKRYIIVCAVVTIYC